MNDAPLAGELRAAAARLADYAGDDPQHWGIAQPEPHLFRDPLLLREDGDMCRVLGSISDLNDRELDLIGLLSPQTAAALSSLVDQLADWLQDATPGELAAATWLAEAQCLARALNRQQAWATHPRGIRMADPDEAVG